MKQYLDLIDDILEPRPMPTMQLLRRPESVFDFLYEDFEPVGYDPHPSIKAPVAV